MRELLERSRRERHEIWITVTDCYYGCCNRPPARRSGYEQVFRGVIADVDDRRLILHSIALGALSYHVIAELAYLQDVTLVD